MEEARIKTNNDRAKTALQKYSKKEGKSIREKIAFRTVIKEEWVGDNEISFKVRNKHVASLMRAEDFVQAVHFEMAQYGAKKEDYEVVIDGTKYD
jgi:hypothetical protein